MRHIAIIVFTLIATNIYAQSPINKNHRSLTNAFHGDTLNMYATKFVMIDKDIIVHVTHELNGEWDFWSDGRRYIPETAMRKVRFSALLALDKSILQVSKMQRGYEAHRQSKNSPWVIEKFKYKD